MTGSFLVLSVDDDTSDDLKLIHGNPRPAGKTVGSVSGMNECVLNV